MATVVGDLIKSSLEWSMKPINRFVPSSDEINQVSSASKNAIEAGFKTADKINTLPLSYKLAKRSFDEVSGKIFGYGDEIPNFYVIKEDTFLSKYLPEQIKNADITVADTKYYKGMLKKIFGTEIKTVKNAAGKVVKVAEGGTKSGKFLAKAAGRIPILNMLISALFEVDDIKRASKNGDLTNQVVRSSAKIGAASAASAIIGQFAFDAAAKSCPRLKTLVGLTGAIAAGVGAEMAVDKTLDQIIGKPLESQNIYPDVNNLDNNINNIQFA